MKSIDRPTGRAFVFRCDLERREWTKLPIACKSGAEVSPITDQNNGEDVGFLVVSSQRFAQNTTIFRVLFQ